MEREQKMGIYLLSLSHKTTPLAVRSLFAYSEREKLQVLEELLESDLIDEAVVLSTCNRMEIYCHGSGKEHWDGRILEAMENAAVRAAAGSKGRESSGSEGRTPSLQENIIRKVETPVRHGMHRNISILYPAFSIMADTVYLRKEIHLAQILQQCVLFLCADFDDYLRLFIPGSPGLFFIIFAMFSDRIIQDRITAFLKYASQHQEFRCFCIGNQPHGKQKYRHHHGQYYRKHI